MKKHKINQNLIHLKKNSSIIRKNVEFVILKSKQMYITTDSLIYILQLTR